MLETVLVAVLRHVLMGVFWAVGFFPVSLPTGFALAYFIYGRSWELVRWRWWDAIWSAIPYLSVAWLLACRLVPVHVSVIAVSAAMGFAIPLPVIVLRMRGVELNSWTRTVGLAIPSIGCTWIVRDLAERVVWYCL